MTHAERHDRPDRTRSLRRIALITMRSRFLWTSVALLVASVTLDHWMADRGGPEAVVHQWGLWAPLVAFVVQTLTTMTPVGAVVIAIVNGMLFPLWLAITINISSGVVGGIGMYYLWRRGDHEFDIQRHMQRLPSWFHVVIGPSVRSLTLLRLLPWAGGGLADLVAGARRVPLRVQITSLVLGYSPGSVVYALIGAGLIAAT